MSTIEIELDERWPFRGRVRQRFALDLAQRIHPIPYVDDPRGLVLINRSVTKNHLSTKVFPHAV